jgi:hypothetical protein
MVTAALTGAAAKPGLTPLGLVELVVIASWILFFAVMLVYAAVLFTARGRSRRRREARRKPAGPRAGRLPAGMDVLRREDPGFGEQLLLEAAQTATLLVFVATTTGDIAPVSRLVTGSFWSTPFGRITWMMARDRRRETAGSAKDGARERKRWNIPLDYHPSVPEFTAVNLGREQRVTVRVSFGQLQAVIQPGARELAAAAAAGSFGSAMVSAGKAAATQRGAVQTDGVSWLAAGGDYELTFVRPSGAITDPSAALADRTCTVCGATYQSELAIACEHCRAPRALPWGDWRLALAEPVQ